MRSRRIEPRHVRHCDVPLRRCKGDSNRRRIWGCLVETNACIRPGVAWRRNIGAIVCLCDVYVKSKILFSCFPEFFSKAWKGNQTRDVPTSATSTPSAAAASDSEEALPSGWSSTVCSATGQPYYWNLSDPNNTVTWERPK